MRKIFLQKIFKNKRQTLSAGFTFIETVVAIGVLIVSVVAPLSLAAQGLRAARIARDQVIANYLAQEGVEFLRYTRDNNALIGRDWLTGFPAECFSETTCRINIFEGPSGTITTCNEKICPALRFQSTTGIYTYNEEESVDWSDTKFTRTITFSYGADSNREISAEVKVSWTDVITERSFTLNEKLFNWQ